MNDSHSAPSDAAGNPLQAMRLLGARAHQLRASTRAADNFNAQDSAKDRDTGSWLIDLAPGIRTP